MIQIIEVVPLVAQHQNTPRETGKTIHAFHAICPWKPHFHVACLSTPSRQILSGTRAFSQQHPISHVFQAGLLAGHVLEADQVPQSGSGMPAPGTPPYALGGTSQQIPGASKRCNMINGCVAEIGRPPSFDHLEFVVVGLPIKI